MNEIEVVYQPPVIFTKDVEFIKKEGYKHLSMEPGAINLLPKDAVLYIPELSQQAKEGKS